MKKGGIKRIPEIEMISKVRSMIEYMYPRIEEEAREIFIHENEEVMKIIKRKADFRWAFQAWFLLKYEFPSEATGMEMADAFPMKFFTKNEKKAIKNFLDYKESLFEILKISEDKRDYKIKDLLDKRTYLIKTFDLPAKFSGGQLIKTMIIKNLREDYFFYGGVKSYLVKNKARFIREMLKEVREDNRIREEKREGVIEWEFNKEQTSKNFQNNPTGEVKQ